MKIKIIVLLCAVAFSQSPVYAESEQDIQDTNQYLSSGSATGHAAPMQPTVPDHQFMSVWHDASTHSLEPGQTMPFNPVDPAFWSKWFDPKSHSNMHMIFSNPAQYAQMMQPGFYLTMMNPAVWAKWANPGAFRVFFDPANWAYWMQPGAYMHAMNPANYMQMANAQAYESFFSPFTGGQPDGNAAH